MRKLKNVLIEAKNWSMNEDNNIGEAVVSQSPLEKKENNFSVCSDCSSEKWVIARFVDGKRIK